MFDAAIKALTQMFSPPFRRVLFKSIGLALLMIMLMGIGLNRVFSWMADSGATWAEASVGGHTAWQVLSWILSFAATLGVITGALFLMPAVTAFVGSFFVDEIAEEVERTYYPAEPPGRALSIAPRRVRRHQDRAACDPGLSLRRAVPAVRGVRPRHHVPRHRLSAEPGVFPARRHAVSLAGGGQGTCAARIEPASSFAGLLIALFVSIPIVNLATPLFAMAMMVHVHKRLSGPRAELIEPKRA